MTCIAAVRSGDTIWVSADSALFSETSKEYMSQKVFWLDFETKWLVGTAGPPALDYILQAEQWDTSISPEMFALRLMMLLKDKDLDDWDIILFSPNGLHTIDSSFAVCEASRGYAAIGSGSEYARGSLHTTTHWKSPQKRLAIAMEAACAWSPSCALPAHTWKYSCK